MKTQNLNLQDENERKQALDPTRSFIVQAPAGSGKTELLTRRFLVLLACVKQPEEILSITFTKKSAAEMRTRIVNALKSAQYPEPESDHEKQTWKLAKCALQQNNSKAWNILENPNRLQIQTIDSFNASLTRQLPLLSNFGAPLEIADNAKPLYQQAVQEFLSHLEENFSWANAIEKLLFHMDNDLAEVEKLLINMLAKRDQWLPYIISNSKNPELRITLEKNLADINTDILTNLHRLFPKEQLSELVEIAKYAAHNLKLENIASPIINCLNTLPEINKQGKLFWQGILNLLFTNDLTWRTKVDKRHGFPAPSSSKNPEEKIRFAEYKNRLDNLIHQLSLDKKLKQIFNELDSLPPYQYYDFQWETLEALHQVLHVLVAQLRLVFQEHGQIDYIENAQAALHALGTDEEPTDLTLALDYKIHHILIDEFQDTSNNQYHLLEKLIAGWQPNDGRTLFVVGDPMQSIYRFREAEVGLFIRARNQGIGHLNLEALKLSVNFRSVSAIVNWINNHFKYVLPPFEDIASGAISYSPSIAHQQDSAADSTVTLHPFINADAQAEAAAIIRIIQNSKQKFPDDKIVILVRSRTHLHALIPALKLANLTFRAHDIEPLAKRPVIQDLLSLTRGLLNLADRIAWLSILRAPWCGMNLADLLIIAGDKSKPILWEQLRSSAVINKLSVSGQKSLIRIIPILEKTLAERRRYSLRQWIEYTWLQIGGPACVNQSSDLQDAEAFLNLLENLDIAYDLPDLQILNEAIENLFASPNNSADDSLQIMTIHNSKGLEFDTVIIPRLERAASVDKKQLLLWMEQARDDNHNHLILSPIQAVGEKENLIYNYIKCQHNIKSEFENSRLLYVAATRAKKQLHFFFNLVTSEKQNEIKEPVNNSLLKKLWPAIHADIKQNITNPVSIPDNSSNIANTKQLKRLLLDWKNPYQKNNFDKAISYHQKKSGFDLPDNYAKHIGIVLHHVLQQISLQDPSWWTNQTSQRKSYLKKHLLKLGMPSNEFNSAIDIIETGVANTLQDARGQWIIHPHTDARSELALTTQEKNIVIDRTFVDEKGTRWIIDYKSTRFTGENLEAFLEIEKALYEKQLLDYYQAMQAIETRPIRMGLYFPLIPAWKEIDLER